MRKFFSKLLGLLLVVALAAALYMWLWTAPINPRAYHPPAKPEMTGPLAPNQDLVGARILARGSVPAPEDVAIGPDGDIFCSCGDGTIRRIKPSGRVEVLVNTEGRPLGMVFDAQGNLIVADAVKGLLSVSRLGRVTVLATEAGGAPIKLADDLDIASDGKIYFSDASARFGIHGYLYDLLESRPTGRLLVYDPAKGKAEVLLAGLSFADGVSLSHNQDYVLVTETYAYRIRRFWLKGPKAGTNDIFADNLPGFPDNISRGSGGRYWLACFTVRNDLLDWMHPHPWIKELLAKLPEFMWPQPAAYGLVLALDQDGRIVRSLQDPEGQTVTNVTSVKEHQGRLYLGSLFQDQVAVVKLQ